MDEDDFEPDTFMRLAICDWVNNIAERAHQNGTSAFDTPEQFITAAEMIEHYCTQGGTVSFECNEGSRKFVRGQ